MTGPSGKLPWWVTMTAEEAEASAAAHPSAHTPAYKPDLTQHGNPGVRWQAQMEAHLKDVRTLTNEALLHGIDPAQAMLRASLAQAAATAALALAVANNTIADEIARSRNES